MGRFNKAQNSFKSGEITPKLDARFESEQYGQALALLENCFVQPQGGAIKRPGFRFVTDKTGDTFFNDGRATLHPFIFSKTEKNLIVLRPDPKGILGSIAAFELDGTLAPIAGASVAFNFAELLGTDDVYGFNFVQTGDTVLIVHNSGKLEPRVLRRTAANTFSIRKWASATQIDVPFRNINAEPTTITATAGAGAADTLTATDPIFNAGHIGSKWRIDNFGAGISGYFLVLGFTSTTVVTGDWIVDLGSVAAFDTWFEPSWSTFRGWPKTVCLFESRLIFAGIEAEPDRTWGGRVNNLFQFMEPKFLQDVAGETTGFRYFGDPQETDPFSYVPASQEVNIIQWLIGDRKLNIGALGAEFTMAGTNDKILSNSAVQLRTPTREGGSPRQAQRAAGATLYVSRDGKQIREFVFDVRVEDYVSRDLNILSDQIIFHQFDGTGDFAGLSIAQLAYQTSRNMLWVLNSRFGLIALTIEKSTSTLAWHRHTIGGVNPKVRSITVLPNEDGTFDDVWAIIERTIDGGQKFYIERMGDDFNHSALFNTSTQEDDKPYFMDSSKRTTGSGVKIFGGYTHLIGETVKVLRDGFVHADVVVNGAGEVIVGTNSDEVIAGLQYKPLIKTLRLEAGSPFENSQGELKRIHQLLLRFHRTYGAKHGRNEANLEAINFKSAGAGMGDPLVLFTGDKKVDFRAEPDDDSRLVISQDEPLPFNLLGIVMKGQTYVS